MSESVSGALVNQFTSSAVALVLDSGWSGRMTAICEPLIVLCHFLVDLCDRLIFGCRRHLSRLLAAAGVILLSVVQLGLPS